MLESILYRNDTSNLTLELGSYNGKSTSKKYILPCAVTGKSDWIFSGLIFCAEYPLYTGYKKTNQKDFVYGNLGQVNYTTTRSFIIFKYWFKILAAPEKKIH